MIWLENDSFVKFQNLFCYPLHCSAPCGFMEIVLYCVSGSAVVENTGWGFVTRGKMLSPLCIFLQMLGEKAWLLFLSTILFPTWSDWKEIYSKKVYRGNVKIVFIILKLLLKLLSNHSEMHPRIVNPWENLTKEFNDTQVMSYLQIVGDREEFCFLEYLISWGFQGYNAGVQKAS